MRRTLPWALLLIGSVLLIGAPSSPGDEVLFQATDPVGDDTGDGDYVYPTHEAFGQGGQADMTACIISMDESDLIVKMSFRDLVDPWQVGNRLTFVAIAVDTAEGGMDMLGHSAGAYLENPSELQIFLAGGTCEILDIQGNKLSTGAVYDVDNEKNTMRLTLPLADIGRPTERWKYTIAAGLQDDYGAGGLGDFRVVDSLAAEWRGGGGIDELDIDPNIYDLIMSPEPGKVIGLFKKRAATQGEILGSYDLEKGTYVVLPSVN